MNIVEQINTGIKDAMRSQNQIRLATLRMLKSKILTADARGNISDQDAIKLFKTYLGNLQEALTNAETANRPELIGNLKSEMAIVQEFLPKALSHEETVKIVKQAIQDSGAKTKKDLGLVMKAAMKLNNTIDGKVTKDIAQQLLID